MSTDPKRITVKIGADISELKRGLLDAQKNLKRAFGRDTIDASRQFATGLAIAGAAILGIGAGALKASADLAMTRQSFISLTGSAGAATKHMRELEKFALSSVGLKMTDATEGSQRLLAMGFTARQVIPILKAAGQAAAATGGGAKQFTAITEAMATMKAKGQVTAREMKTLISAGLPAWEILAKKIGVSVPEAMEKMKAGGISADQVISALTEGMADKYAGTAERMSGETNELISDIIDLAAIGLREVGDSMAKSLNLTGFFKNMADGMQSFIDTLRSGGLQAAIDKFVGADLQLVIIAIAGAITAAMLPALASMAIAAWAALLPLWPWIAAGAALAATIFFVYKNAKVLQEFIVGSWNAMKYFAMEAIISIGRAFIQMAEIFLTGGEKVFGWIPGFKEKMQGAREKLDELKAGLNDASANNLKTWREDTDKLKESLKKTGTQAKQTDKDLDLSGGLKKTEAAAADTSQAFKDFEKGVVGFGDSMAGTFTDIIMGTKSASEALQDLGKQLVQLFLKMAFQKALTALIPGMGGGGGGTAGSQGGSGTLALAGGGIVRRPTMALIGEAGAEAVIPLDRAGALGGPGDVQVNINNQTGQDAAATATSKTIGRKTIIDIFLTGVANNEGGLRTAIKAVK